jgi:DNA polymerase III sliding clamp (beta) subunit (PCNA family)
MDRKELMQALEIVKPGLASKAVIDQSTSFAFIGNRIITYNDEISISHPVEGLAIDGAVRSEELYQLLSRITKDEIEITMSEAELLLKAGRARAGIVLQQEIKLPLDELGNRAKWKPLPDDFIKAADFVTPSCSKDMSRPTLTCINVRNDGIIEASDDYRITRYKIEEMPIPTFLLPGSSARILARYKPIKIAESKGWMHFKCESGTIFSCRIYEGEFPNVDKHFEVKGKKIEFPDTLVNALDRAAVFGAREHQLDDEVTIKIMDNKINISSENDFGWFDEDVKIQYDDKGLGFIINPSFLKSILEQLSSCMIGERCMKFDGPNWMHVISLSQ